MYLVIGVSTIILMIVCVILYEIRIRKPDQVVLFEKNNVIKLNKGKFYFRHFNLPLSKTVHSIQMTVETAAKGNIDIKVKLFVSAALSINNIQNLVKIGGWNQNATAKASKDLEINLNAVIKEFTEQFGIEELSSDKISLYLNQRSQGLAEKLGLEIVSLAVQSFEAVDPQISEAMKQRESARILEQTELLNQNARISSIKVKLDADEQIAIREHELQLRIFDLKNKELSKENELALIRTEEELKRGKLKLELEKAELNLMKENPELLLLTPQAARLAEASQSLKNARTIVSLTPGEISQGADLLGIFQDWLKNSASHLTQKNGSDV